MSLRAMLGPAQSLDQAHMQKRAGKDNARRGMPVPRLLSPSESRRKQGEACVTATGRRPGAPSSVSVMLTEKKERALKDPPPSPALSAVAHPRRFSSASTLPAPSCLRKGF